MEENSSPVQMNVVTFDRIKKIDVIEVKVICVLGFTAVPSSYKNKHTVLGF